MSRFTVVDDGYVILRRKGVFRQAKLYRRKDRRYAGAGGGFLLLAAQGATSHPDTRWVTIQESPDALEEDAN